MSSSPPRGAPGGEETDAGPEHREAETLLLFGATGLVGGELLGLLLEEGARVVSYGRRPTGRTHPRLEERLGDPARWEPPPGGAAAAFCALGTTLRRAGSREAFRAVDHDLVVESARLARRAGARHFLLVSATGADPSSRVFYNRVKGEAEGALREMGFAALTLLRPSLLLGARDERRPAERVGQVVGRALAPLLRGRLRRYRPVPARAVAGTLVRAWRAGGEGVRVVESEEISLNGGGRG